MMIISIFIVLIFGTISNCFFCNDGSNPCLLDDIDAPNAYFLPEYGYHCFDSFNGQVICTCPDNSTTRDRPCRLCDRDPNPCGSASSFVACTDINLSFSCVCNDGQGGFVVTTKPCDNIITASTTTTTRITITSTPQPEDICDNQGVRDPTTNLCNCPSGYNGTKCEIKRDNELCNNVQCMRRGVCAVRQIIQGGTLYQAKCLCPLGSDGEFCEKQSMTGSCTPTHCLNGGICQERNLGASRYIICQCKPGWAGLRCEKQYFRCQSHGYFVDEYMKDQGKYFWCISHNNDYLLRQKSCPNGLKFNFAKQLCLY